MISQAARYAIRSLAYVDSLESSEFVSVRLISKELTISPTFLAKILKRLVETRLIVTYRGPNGGIRLARPASTITLRQVIEAVDGEDLFTECVLGLPGCGNEVPCPMHESWIGVRENLRDTFDAQTIARLGERYREDGARLSAS